MEKNNTKLNKIYKILRIILIVFVLFSAMKSCAKAMTQEDVIEYLQQTKQNFTMSLNKFSNANKLIDSTDFNTYINDTYLENFTQCIIKAWDSGAYNLYFFDSTTPTFELKTVTGVTPPINEKVWKIDNNLTGISYIAFRYETNGDYYYYYDSNTNWTFNTNNNNFTQSTTAMFYSGTLNINSNSWVGYNIYNYILPHNIIFDGNTYTADVRVGEYYNINNITYKLYIVQDNTETEIPFNYNINYQNGIYGKIGLLNITSLGVLNNTNCKLKMYNNDNLLITSSLFNITSNGNQGNTSGEQGGNGNINLTPIQNSIDNVNTSINTQGQNITNAIKDLESGEQARQTFWEKAYNDLFTISGDYIKNKLEEIQLDFGISGEEELETAFINIIQNTGQDFVISWESFTPHFSVKGQQINQGEFIPSGEINFSKMERENIHFKETMGWVRVIVGFSLGALLIRNYWTTILMCLGIGIQVYDKNDEEKAIISKTYTSDKNGNTITTTTIKKGNEKWVTRK